MTAGWGSNDPIWSDILRTGWHMASPEKCHSDDHHLNPSSSLMGSLPQVEEELRPGEGREES